MPKRKVDRVELNQMLKAGKSQREVAQVFGVTEGAISKAKKELNLAVVKNVVMESAHKVLDKNLDAVQQLEKINRNANELLDLLMKWNRGDKVALQVLESQVRRVRVGKTKKFVEEFKFKDPRELAIRAMAEIRQQLNHFKLENDGIKRLFYDHCHYERSSGIELIRSPLVENFNLRMDLVREWVKSEGLEVPEGTILCDQLEHMSPDDLQEKPEERFFCRRCFKLHIGES